MMRKVYILVGVLILAFLLVYLTLFKSKLRIMNAVDKIDSKEALTKFVNSHMVQIQQIADYRGWRRGLRPLWIRNHDSIPERWSFSKIYKAFLDSVETDPYIKQDFNQDGKTDLIVECDDKDMLVFISDTGTQFKLMFLQGELDGPRGHAFLRKIDDVPDGFLMYNMNIHNSHFDVFKDTLVYKYGEFIPINRNPIKCTYKLVHIYRKSSWGCIPREFDIEVNEAGQVLYKAGGFCGIDRTDTICQGAYTYQLDKETFNELNGLINYVNPECFDNSYSVNATDEATYYLEITYLNGVKFKIKDYGMRGTYGLMAFYDYIENLRRNLKWVKVSDK